MKSNASKKEKAKNMEQLNRRYTTRITVAKHGKAAYQGNDFMNAIKHYNTYFKIIADVKEIDEKRINPGLFNPERELTEMMLISHIFWDLTRIYDRTPHLRNEFQRCMNQFVAFTTGHPYQVVNSEMLRRYIRAGKLVNKKEFQDAYQKIYVNSKKCYVATHCFGYDDQITNQIRRIKPLFLKSHMGHTFVEYYYLYSPHLVKFLERYPRIDFAFTSCFARPILRKFAKICAFIK